MLSLRRGFWRDVLWRLMFFLEMVSCVCLKSGDGVACFEENHVIKKLTVGVVGNG